MKLVWFNVECVPFFLQFYHHFCGIWVVECVYDVLKTRGVSLCIITLVVCVYVRHFSLPAFMTRPFTHRGALTPPTPSEKQYFMRVIKWKIHIDTRCLHLHIMAPPWWTRGCQILKSETRYKGGGLSVERPDGAAGNDEEAPKKP